MKNILEFLQRKKIEKRTNILNYPSTDIRLTDTMLKGAFEGAHRLSKWFESLEIYTGDDANKNDLWDDDCGRYTVPAVKYCHKNDPDNWVECFCINSDAKKDKELFKQWCDDFEEFRTTGDFAPMECWDFKYCKHAVYEFKLGNDSITVVEDANLS